MKIKTIAMAAAAGCVLAVGGGVTAYASIPDSGGVIHGCYNKGDGSLSVIDTSVVSTCPKGQNPLNWNQTGQQGPPGPPGQQGPPGSPGQQGTPRAAGPGRGHSRVGGDQRVCGGLSRPQRVPSDGCQRR